MRLAALPLSDGARSDTFFGDRELDRTLDRANDAFWSALVGHVESDLAERPRLILDVGCHGGGLLERLGRSHPEARLFGIEPVAALRSEAEARLYRLGAEIAVCGLEGWDQLGEKSVDLLVCHEVLYLVADLPAFMRRVSRVLAPRGRSYFVLGCHTENPVWPEWRGRLIADGIDVYDHRPFDVLDAAHGAGLSAEMQPLRRSGWVSYDPTSAAYPFPSARLLLDHHYRHKLIFKIQRDVDGDDRRS